ncbi:hypothetical protein EDM59_20470 [Brevibacillus nitrificans]|uniref:Uncharacterized protein n=1 Tax=Brevibacillus nitrificans TaxID=651560 RepID=A0A3M8D375_9BACL|nr:hypothetical protein EDM59_20470 [Brevibacillus nitrificans]
MESIFLFNFTLGAPINAMVYISRWMNLAKEKISRTEKGWLIDPGVLRDTTMLVSLKEELRHNFPIK